jgi:hypothetical protein
LPGTGKPVAPVNQQPVTNNSSDFLSTLSFYQLILITIIGLLIVTGFFFWVRKENRKQPENLTPIGNTQQNTVIEKEIPQSKNYLALSEEKLSQDDSKGFYQALNSELRKFLSLYLQLTPEEINKKRIAEEMDKKGVSIINTLRLQELMDDIEWQLYTPFAEHYKMQNTYEKASALIHSLSNSKA